MNKEILNVDELAEYTGYSKNYIYQLVFKREIPHSKPKGRLFFAKEKIDKWLLSNARIGSDEKDIIAANHISTVVHKKIKAKTVRHH